MAIPTGLGCFHAVAIVVGSISFFIFLKEFNDAKLWNKCAPTLSINHCPQQDPEDAFNCRKAKLQMDSFVRSAIQSLRRKHNYQELTVFLTAANLVLCVLAFILYIFIPLNGQLCLGKGVNIVACVMYVFTTILGIRYVLIFNEIKGPYEGNICHLSTTLPLDDFGEGVLRTCFQDFHICQNAVLAFSAVGIGLIAAMLHFLAFFSALWDCRTHIDASDWGTVENMPEESIIPRPDPPSYGIEDEKTQRQRLAYARKEERALKKKIQEIEKRRRKEEQRLKIQEMKSRKERFRKRREKERLEKLEERKKKKAEEKQKQLEKKKQKEAQVKREQEIEKKLGEDVQSNEKVQDTAANKPEEGRARLSDVTPKELRNSVI